MTEMDSSSRDDRKCSGKFVLSLLNCVSHQYSKDKLISAAAHTVACESADPGRMGGVGLSSSKFSVTSSSISVVSVPFEVTGDGPTISFGLVIWMPLGEGPPSIEFGRRLDESAELRADLLEEHQYQ